MTESLIFEKELRQKRKMTLNRIQCPQCKVGAEILYYDETKEQLFSCLRFVDITIQNWS